MTIFSSTPFRSSPWQASPFEDPFAVAPAGPLYQGTLEFVDDGFAGWWGHGTGSGTVNPIQIQGVNISRFEINDGTLAANGELVFILQGAVEIPGLNPGQGILIDFQDFGANPVSVPWNGSGAYTVTDPALGTYASITKAFQTVNVTINAA